MLLESNTSNIPIILLSSISKVKNGVKSPTVTVVLTSSPAEAFTFLVSIYSEGRSPDIEYTFISVGEYELETLKSIFSSM